MRIVFGTKVARAPVLKALEKITGIDLVVLDDVSDVPPLIEGADALIISDPRGEDGRKIAAALRAPGCKVQWVQLLTAGAEGLLAHGVPEAIAITNQGGAVAWAVAEHAMALILTLSRQMPTVIDRSRRGEWSRDFSSAPLSLERRTLAIIGFGNIGRQLARRAKGFDLEIAAVTRTPTPDPLADEVHPMSALGDVLGRADVAVLCIAATGATRHVMNKEAFSAMKKGALFVNVTRGETVDQAALREALESGHLGGAALDVTEPEPLPKDDPLWRAPNLIISPHMAGAGGTGTGSRIAAVVVENIERFRAGREFAHRVKA